MQDILQQRLDFLGLGGDARARLAPISASLEHHLDMAIAGFQARLAATPSAARFLYGCERIEANGEGLLGHWRALVRGEFDPAFAEAAQRMGQRHARIGLEPRWHVGSYAGILDGLVKGVVRDQCAAGLASRRGALALFAGTEDSRRRDMAEAMADGLSALLAGVLLDIDLGLAGYVGKLRDEARAASEAQRSAMRQAVMEMGGVLEAAARGEADTVALQRLGPEFAPLCAGAERLADRVGGLVVDLETSSRALAAAAGDVMTGARSLVAARDDRARAGEDLAQKVDAHSTMAKDMAGGLGAAARTVRAMSRRCASARRSVGDLAPALADLRAGRGEEDEMAAQLESLDAAIRLLAAQAESAGSGAGPSGAQLRSLGASLGGLAAAWRAHAARSEQALERMHGRVGELALMFDGLTPDLGAAGRQAADLARAGSVLARGLEDTGLVATTLAQALRADDAHGRSAWQGLQDALSQSEAFTRLAAVLGEAPVPAAAESGPPVPAQDQTALAAHWHAP